VCRLDRLFHAQEMSVVPHIVPLLCYHGLMQSMDNNYFEFLCADI